MEEIKAEIGRVAPTISGEIQDTSFKKFITDIFSETIKGIYLVDIVNKTMATMTGESMQNDINSFLKIYLKIMLRLVNYE
jgi:hypothetical protein